MSLCLASNLSACRARYKNIRNKELVNYLLGFKLQHDGDYAIRIFVEQFVWPLYRLRLI